MLRLSGLFEVLLGSPVVPFCPFSFWVPLLKPKKGKKGTLIIKGLLGSLDYTLNPEDESGIGLNMCSRTCSALGATQLERV